MGLKSSLHLMLTLLGPRNRRPGDRGTGGATLGGAGEVKSRRARSFARSSCIVYVPSSKGLSWRTYLLIHLVEVTLDRPEREYPLEVKKCSLLPLTSASW